MNPENDVVLSIKNQTDEVCDLLVGDDHRQFLVSIETRANRISLIDPKSGKRFNIKIGSEIGLNGKISELIQQSFHSERAGISRSMVTETYQLDTRSAIIISLPAGAIIEKIEIVIEKAFRSSDDIQHNISIEDENGKVLMPETWNDPNMEGCYSTSLNYIVGPDGFILIKHDLDNTDEGSGYIKLYESIPDSQIAIEENIWTAG